MAIVTIDDKYLTDIANAIRQNNGETTTYTTSEMPAAIAGLTDYSSEGGNADDDFLRRYLYSPPPTGYTLAEYTNSNLTEIRAYQFYNCGGGFSKLSFPNVTTVGAYSFYGTMAAAIDLPSLTTINADWVFRNATEVNCPNLTEIKGSYVFFGVETEINLPNLTTVEGSYVFGGYFIDDTVRTFYFPQLETATGEWFEYSATNNPLRIILPKIQTVGPMKHSNAVASSQYSSIVLPGSTIPTMADYDASTDKWGSYAYTDCDFYIYVPASMLDAYIDSTWGTFFGSARIRTIEDYPDVLEGYEV